MPSLIQKVNTLISANIHALVDSALQKTGGRDQSLHICEKVLLRARFQTYIFIM